MKLLNVRLVIGLFLLATAQTTKAYLWNVYDYNQTVVSNSTTRYVRIAWPDDYPYVRGIFVHLAGGGGDTRAAYLLPEFREFLRFHQIAFIGSKGWENPPGSEQLSVFTNGLASFITQSGHAEFANCPFIFFGHSAGGSAEYSLVKSNVTKSISWVSASGGTGVGLGPSDTYPIPALTWAGSSDIAGLANSMEAWMATNRPSGLLGAYAELGGADHVASGDSGASRAMAVAYMNEMLLLGYPANQCTLNGPLTLTRLAESSGWLVDTNTIRRVFCTLTNYAAYPGTKPTAYWLPNQNAAYVYRAFASHSPPIVLSSPADLAQYNAGQNITITVNDASFAGWTNMAIYSFATNLANFTSGSPTWTITNATPGMHVFSAIATKSGTNVVTRPVMVQVVQTAAPAYVCSGTIWYAATNGTAGGTGTIGSPWDLQTAFNKVGTVKPGDRIQLRGGNYTHAPQFFVPLSNEGVIFSVQIAGSASGDIIIESYPGEWAMIDGGAWGGTYAYHANARPTLCIGSSGNPAYGNYVAFQNLEVYSSSTEARLSGGDSSFPPEIARSDGIYVFANGVKIRNCIIHDVTTGISIWTQSGTVEVYGNLIYNNGWRGTPHMHGHNFYCQHNYGSLATIKRNLSVAPYDNGIQMYGTSSAQFSGFRVQEGIWVGEQLSSGRLVLGTQNGGAANRVRDDQVTDNCGYGADGQFYYAADDDAYADAIVTGNYFVHTAWAFSSWQSLIATNNLLIGVAGYNKILAVRTNATFLPWDLNRNTYCTVGIGTPFNLDTTGGGFFNLANWRTKTGYDANSTEITPLPTTNYIIVQSNAYNTNRAQACAYNWSGADYLALSIAGLGWATNMNLLVRNAHNYFNDTVTATSTSTNTIVVDMRAIAHTMAIPYGDSASTVSETFPNFGAWILEYLGTNTPTPPTPTFALTVTGQNPTAVFITMSPADVNGASSGTTPFGRTVSSNSVTTLTAPLSSSTGTVFQKWQRNGVDFTTGFSAAFTNSVNTTMNAVYLTPTPPPAGGAPFGSRRRGVRF